MADQRRSIRLKRDLPGQSQQGETLTDCTLPDSSTAPSPTKIQRVHPDKPGTISDKPTPPATALPPHSTVTLTTARPPPPLSQAHPLPNQQPSGLRPAANTTLVRAVAPQTTSVAPANHRALPHKRIFFGNPVCEESQSSNGTAVNGLATSTSTALPPQSIAVTTTEPPQPRSQANPLQNEQPSGLRPAANTTPVQIRPPGSLSSTGPAMHRPLHCKRIFFKYPVCEGSRLSNGAAINGLAKIVSQQKLSKECFEAISKHIMKVLPKGSSNYPSRVDEYLKTSNYSLQASKVSHQCLGCLDVDSVFQPMSCKVCGTSLRNTSVQNDLRAVIKDLFENHQLADLIDKQSNKNLTDICNGAKFKSAKLDMSGKYDLCLVQNFDRFAIEGEGQVWRNFLAIVDVPIEHRQSFIILSNLWLTPEHTQPRMEDFMGPFVSLIQDLHANGVEWTHPVTKLVHKSKICVILSVANGHNRALLQNLNSPTDLHGCSFCEIPGRQTQNSLKVCYPFVNEKCESRSTRTMTKNIVSLNCEQRALHLPPLNHVKGVRGPSCLARLPNFDLGTSFTPDYVRSCLLGVVKSHLDLITVVKNQSEKFYLGANSKFIINARLEAIKMPPFTKTLPPSLAATENWNVAEYRNWLLYYSLPCLERMWSDSKYLEHFAHLVFAIHTMLSTEVSQKDLTDAAAALRKFCSQYGELYGRDNESIHLHVHLHFARSVIEFGPLYGHSSLMFEDESEALQRHLTAAETVLSGANNSFLALHALRALRQVCDRDSDKTLSFLSALPQSDFFNRVVTVIKEVCKVLETPKLYSKIRYCGTEYMADDTVKTKHSSYLMYKGHQSSGRTPKAMRAMAFANVDAERTIVIGENVELKEPRYSFDSFKVKHILEFEEVQTNYVFCNISDIISPLVCVNLSETVGVASDCKVLCIPPNLIEDQMLL